MMNINYKATGIELTPAIKSYAHEKVTALEKLIDPNDTSVQADVELGQTTHHHQSGVIFFAEINLHVSDTHLRAVTQKEDLYAAIDEVKDDMMRQLQEVKDKKSSAVRKGGRKFKEFLRNLGIADE